MLLGRSSYYYRSRRKEADDSPAVLQFANLLTVGMGAYFATDLASVQRHCTPIQSRGSLVRRHLDHSILVEHDTLESCRAFISDCLVSDHPPFWSEIKP